jgi:hypothetical protein
VRKGAVPAHLEAGTVPECIGARLMSIRAYDVANFMTDARVCSGPEVVSAIQAMFMRDEVAYIHLHNANRGCFSCAVVRA